MKRTPVLALALCAFFCAFFTACGPSPGPNADSFSFEVTVSDSYPGLPALQSFALGQTDSCWIMVGGRTNGFHGFGNQENFPSRMANAFVFAYNIYTHELDSISVDSLAAPLNWQFRSTNVEHVQVNDYLYICGGYGIKVVNGDTSWVTHSAFTRIDIPQMVNAVHTGSGSLMRQSVIYEENPVAQATGGELFYMGGKFYLVVGHNFTGLYSDSLSTQVYVDAVRVFNVTDIASVPGIHIDPASVHYITDGLADSVTQFRRRDLVVAPAVYGPNKVGVTTYGGVFTYTSGYPSKTSGNPFQHPIYVFAASDSFSVDTGYSQISNVYSAPILTMYSPQQNTMFTTMFGGLGDTSQVNGDNAAFTKAITTIKRNNANMQSVTLYNPTGLPHYAGAEGVFVLSKDVPRYATADGLDVVNFDSLQGRMLMGHIYGGILSDSTQWNNEAPVNITRASNLVYDVYINFGNAAKKK